MDAQVPGNKPEEVGEQKPLSQWQLSQMAEFKENVRKMIREQVDRQHTETRKRMGLVEAETEEVVVREKKPRQSFKFTFPGPPSLLTARDLARWIPADEGSLTIVCNPERGLFGFKRKIVPEVETVAKARGGGFRHTLIFSTKFESVADIEGLVELAEQQQRRLAQQ